MRIDPNQKDFFKQPLYESREPVPAIDPERFNLRMKTAMSEVLRVGEFDRHQVASEMARLLNSPTFSKAMLEKYVAPGDERHQMSLLRFKTFVRITDAPQLWDLAVSDDGLLVLQGDEARLAEAERLRQARREINAELRRLTAKPVTIKRGK